MNLKQREKGGVWYAHFEGPGGRRMRLSTGLTDYHQAQLKALDMMRASLTEDAPIEERKATSVATSLTLACVLRDCWATVWADKKSSRSFRLRVVRISREIGHWTLEQVTYERLKNWANGLTSQNAKTSVKMVSAATKNRYMSCISTALREARRKNPAVVIPEMPHWREDNIKDRFVTAEEEAKILASLQASSLVPWGRDQSYMEALYIVLVDTGLRLSEAVVELGPGSVMPSLQDPQYITLSTGSTKNGRGRSIPLFDRTKAAVVKLVLHPRHRQVKAENIGKQFRTLMDRLEIEGVTIHTLRHTCASRLIQSGKVSLHEVSAWLGHSGLTVTQRYAHLAPGHLMGLVTKLGDLGQPAAASEPVPASVPRRNLRLVS